MMTKKEIRRLNLLIEEMTGLVLNYVRIRKRRLGREAALEDWLKERLRDKKFQSKVEKLIKDNREGERIGAILTGGFNRRFKHLSARPRKARKKANN